MSIRPTSHFELVVQIWQNWIDRQCSFKSAPHIAEFYVGLQAGSSPQNGAWTSIGLHRRCRVVTHSV